MPKIQFKAQTIELSEHEEYFCSEYVIQFGGDAILQHIIRDKNSKDITRYVDVELDQVFEYQVMYWANLNAPREEWVPELSGWFTKEEAIKMFQHVISYHNKRIRND